MVDEPGNGAGARDSGLITARMQVFKLNCVHCGISFELTMQNTHLLVKLARELERVHARHHVVVNGVKHGVG